MEYAVIKHYAEPYTIEDAKPHYYTNMALYFGTEQQCKDYITKMESAPFKIGDIVKYKGRVTKITKVEPCCISDGYVFSVDGSPYSIMGRVQCVLQSEISKV